LHTICDSRYTSEYICCFLYMGMMTPCI